MTENRPSVNAREGDDSSADALEFAEGRYLYCVVRTDGEEGFETSGLEDEPVSVVTRGDLGAVVHECSDVYDSADLTTIRRWVVAHQSVVDDAGETFGTPLPFQFDTILKGDDETVREWLGEHEEEISSALDALAGHWEYRVEVVRNEPVAEESLLEGDEQLANLEDRIDEAGEGTAFLLEKQYERRVNELRRSRRRRLADDLRERLVDHTREVHELERTPGVTLEGDDTGRGVDETEAICRLTLLAAEDEQAAIGAVLDDVAKADGLEIRFTGPWPPYTFSPELGGEPDESAGGK
ncbi:gas vesicle protein GvpL [Natrialbaceae archaeon A-gly3]